MKMGEGVFPLVATAGLTAAGTGVAVGFDADKAWYACLCPSDGAAAGADDGVPAPTVPPCAITIAGIKHIATINSLNFICYPQELN